jgi:hypothetical protein
MLPIAYESPAALVLLIVGAIACFAGYRLFRMVLAIYGFIAGAMLASSMMASSNTVGMVLAALAGGVIGALVLFFAYFLGIALVGAGLGALVAHAGWAQISPADPPALIIITLAALGAIAALVLQRLVIIVGTAFSGAWIMMVGALTLWDRTSDGVRSASEVWILYPLAPASRRLWVLVAWAVLGVIGTMVQLRVTGRKR